MTTRFPFRRFFAHIAYVTVLNIFCAIVITSVTGRPDRFPITLFFSICIGTTIFVPMEVIRLTFWGRGEKTNWKVFAPILLVLVPVCQVAGTYLGSLLLGLDLERNTPVLWSGRWLGDLLFTYTATGAALIFFVGRERLARAHVDAANEREIGRAHV